MRTCIKCGKPKPVTEFWFHHGTVLRGACKTCYIGNRASWRRGGGEPNRAKRLKGKLCKTHPECATIDRAEVLRRGQGICGICRKSKVRKHWHMDHIIPLSRGGLHCYYNLQPSHIRCNLRKGNKVLATQSRG